MAIIRKCLSFFSGASPEKKRTTNYILLVTLLIILICILASKLIVDPANESRFNKAINKLLEQQKQSAISYKSSVIQQLVNYAQHEKTQLLLDNHSKEIIGDGEGPFFDLQQRILESLPHANKIQFYLPRQAQQEKNNGGSIGFVALDMINRMETNTSTHPEAAKPKGSPEWEIHWVTPVYQKKDGQSKTDAPPIAILYASTSLAGLKTAMSAYDRSLAKTVLLQRIGRQQRLRFLELGAGDNRPAQSIDVPLSHWQISIEPSSFLYNKVSYFPPWLTALITALSAVALWGAYQLAKRKNEQEAVLYKTLDVKTVTRPDTEATEATSFADPLYLSDQQVVIEEADKTLVDGGHKDKETNQRSKPVKTDSSSHVSGLNVPSHIFRAYDIRGLINEELTPEIAEAVGKSVATEALEQGETTLIIGYDARTHSPLLYEHVKQGVLSTGCNVIQAGLVPTPLLNFATVFSDQSSSGIVVTASHNPSAYNGFKMIINERTLVDDDIKKLHQRITRGELTKGKKGQLIEQNFAADYIDTILADIAINTGLHIVIDAANGAASELAPRLFNELGCQVTPLFCNFDGNFPNHDPDPSIDENLKALIEKVASKNADIGIALDGDGDRLVAVTSSGKIIWPDQLLMLFARDVVSRNPGCDVIFDIKSTRQLNQVISSYGGRPVMWKTGHSHMKSKMQETGALLAGEFSGHIFFKERWFGFDDGIYAAARLLEIMSLRDQSLDAMLDTMPSINATPEIKISVAEEEKFGIIDRLIEQGDFAAGEKTTIDGLRIDFDDGWGLVRASNTSAALTLRFEAKNENGIEQLKTLFKRELHKIDSSLSMDF
ncbi:MAG: phosphomannomutase/phosphoglucomutase [Cellvibrionaceae bacterium]|jgi:phosphomannomutase/phosphoglucomutase